MCILVERVLRGGPQSRYRVALNLLFTKFLLLLRICGVIGHLGRDFVLVVVMFEHICLPHFHRPLSCGQGQSTDWSFVLCGVSHQIESFTISARCNYSVYRQCQRAYGMTEDRFNGRGLMGFQRTDGMTDDWMTEEGMTEDEMTTLFIELLLY